MKGDPSKNTEFWGVLRNRLRLLGHIGFVAGAINYKLANEAKIFQPGFITRPACDMKQGGYLMKDAQVK